MGSYLYSHAVDTIEVTGHTDFSPHHILEANLGRRFGATPIIRPSSPIPNRPVHMVGGPTPPKIGFFQMPPPPSQPPPPPPSTPPPTPPS
ncbi:hypothetical protein L484_024524 [Morus notabilis]|uniref:Uncharacterized protein n=1 Tax=Morus notabilis TaxID=981085 RepID=W9RHL8_9ROSA|nr:hypothetical protein L484_024524 [Morus notabilis]